MGYLVAEYEPSSTPPKLSLFSLPSKPQEPPGMQTPPIHTLASIPFQWEEAPGKPRATTTSTTPQSKTVRSLELPPRLLTETKITTPMPSPTTVLDGPYEGRSLSHTLSFSFRKGQSTNLEGGLVGGVRYRKRNSTKDRLSFVASRWGSFKENSGVVMDSFDFSSSVSSGAQPQSDSKVKITKVRRRSSFLSFSHTSSHLWTNIYEGFKQAVPWRRRQ
ncbi:unnamed protein product [Ilex paraguariensis]|uniref:Uncharacterized protein n=1 Tax=Ilex paraguariensis TaxID=185542 RepID=A0ABC8RX01_9AQUA